MIEEARLEPTEHGQVPGSEGWFVLNAADARWRENAAFGTGCTFEGAWRFPGTGINLRVIGPGQPACLYHRENQQEDFLVLSGECLLLVEEQERRLKAWDFVHCPAGTDHVFVGAGDGPCAILMIGQRKAVEELHYPVSDLARRYGASAEQATDSPQEAYTAAPPTREVAAAWPLAP